MEMVIKDKRFTRNYTAVTLDSEYGKEYNAPHRFKVWKSDDVIDADGGVYISKDAQPLVAVDFQCGPIKENGVNGISNEDALLMVLTRLEAFQNSPYACDENAKAISNIEAAVKCLRERTNKRAARGVEGTSAV